MTALPTSSRRSRRGSTPRSRAAARSACASGTAASCPRADGAPVIVVNSPRAIARVIHERSELGFGRAWVAGELDVDGDLGETLVLAQRFRGITVDRKDLLAALRAARRLNALPLREPEPPQSEARLRGRLHSLRRDKQAIQHHYDVSNRFYRLVLGPTMVYSCAYFASRGRVARRRAEAQARRRLPQAQPAAERAAARRRLRLGLARDPRRHPLRRPRGRRDDLARAGRTRARARARGGARGRDRDPARRLPRHRRRALRQDRERRDGRARRHRAAARLLRPPARAARSPAASC